MELKNLLDAKSRQELREWLIRNYKTETECWVIVKRGRPKNDGTFWYIDAVEEAMCFGWIDSTTKKVSDGMTAQKLSPRKPKSLWSELNKERCRRMERLGLMTDAGRAVLPDMSDDGFVIDSDILKALKSDPVVWENFNKFPILYQKVRIDTIQIKKKQPKLFASRLEKFITNTRAGIMFGEWNDNGRLLYDEYDGETYVAVPEEAEIVRLIFGRFTSGIPLGEIKRELDGMGAASCRGYGISYGQMNYILRNEIYVGDRKYQKCFVQDPITKSKVPNRGQLPQYYVKDDHAPIISREVFAAAQAEISRRSGFINPTYPFTRKIKCSACGMFFTRRIYRSDAKWFCRSKKEVGMTCKSHSYLESELYKIFTEVLGTDTFDSEVFEASAKEIISLPDGSLEIKFFDGTTKVWQMPPPPKKPKPKPGRKRPAHLFDGKIFCGQCGRRYGRATSDSKDRHLYWYCRAKSHHGVTCDSVNYPDAEIKEIFCGIMGQESFDEGYFLKTVERMVVQKTGSIDFHLKDGTARHYETLKLRNSIHRTTSTDEFIGKIKCASCGNLYHRYSCYGTYVYWKCSGKSKAGTECCGKDLADFNIRKVSAYIMGLEEFDGAEFGKQVEGITALEDGSLEFNFYGGRTELWQRA